MRRGGMAGFWLPLLAVAAVVGVLSPDDEGETRADRVDQREARAAREAARERRERRAERRERAWARRTAERREDRRREADAARAAAAIPDDAVRTTVTDVADGDTVDLAGLGSSRLIGVDTPEVYFGEECFSSRASEFTKASLPVGATVYFRRGVERRDRYGRDLVYVWLEDGTFFNALLAERGFAVSLTIPPNVEFAELFRELAAAARDGGRGLWARGTCGGDADMPAG